MSEQSSPAPSNPNGEGPLSSHERLERALEPTNSNMGLRDYLEFADIGLEDLKGQVLDLGSGDLDRFSREASEHGIEVTSVDPFLVTPQQRTQVREGGHLDFLRWGTDIPWQRRSVAAIGQELPFKQESFDTIVSSGAVPGYLDPRDYPDAVHEIGRVLKPGGKAYLFPLFEIPNEPAAPYNEEEFVKALDASGLSYSMKAINDPKFAVSYKVAIIERPEDPVANGSQPHDMEQGGESRYWEKTATTGRSLEEYLRSMHLTREELTGKRVLDVGAGAANFARDIQSEQLDVDVVSLDPDFALDDEKRAAKRSKTIGWRGEIEADPQNSVAGVAEQTPFADDSFDLVLANSSVPEYFPIDDTNDYQDRFLKVLEEFDRILKTNGEIRIFPNSVHMESADDSYEELPYEKAALATFLANHSYTTESITLDGKEDEWKAVLVLRKQES